MAGKILRAIIYYLRIGVNVWSGRSDSSYDVVAQKNLMVSYRVLSDNVGLSFRDVGFSVYSQHDEDGILLYIFSRIGVNFHKGIEICCGTGDECNLANLVINHRWVALMIDGSQKNIDKAQKFFAKKKEVKYWPPVLKKKWITKDNINDLVSQEGFFGEIDLLSLDIDGNDYWIWKELTVVSPRVVVLEFNHLLGPEKALSIPYQPDFVAEFNEHGSDYCGASLMAFIKLGKVKGYRLVGTNSIGTNAFFIRNDVGNSIFPEIEPELAFVHPRVKFGQNVRYINVKNKTWVEV